MLERGEELPEFCQNPDLDLSNCEGTLKSWNKAQERWGKQNSQENYLQEDYPERDVGFIIVVCFHK